LDARHTRFYAALAVFVAWVAGLALLAALTGRRPVAKPSRAAPPATAAGEAPKARP
jgi:hypothetical protein